MDEIVGLAVADDVSTENLEADESVGRQLLDEVARQVGLDRANPASSGVETA